MMRLGGRIQSKNLVGKRACLNRNVTLFAELHKQRVLCDAESMSDALRSEKNSVVEVGVGLAAVVVRLARVQDKRQVQAECRDLFTHRQQLWKPVSKRVPGIFLAL